MIAVDTNLLVFAHRGNASAHQAALNALQPVFEGAAPWALPWPCVHEFISITTNPGIYKPASALSEALCFLEQLFGSPQFVLLSESPGYFEKLRENQSVCAFCALDFRLFVVSCSVRSATRTLAGLVCPLRQACRSGQ